VSYTDSSISKPAHSWSAVANVLASLAFLWALSITLFTSTLPEAQSVNTTDSVHTASVTKQPSTFTELAQATLAAIQAGITGVGTCRTGIVRGHIPGSKLKTAAEVAAGRESLACLAQRGRWVLNPQPRRLPWNYARLDLCDVRYVVSGQGQYVLSEQGQRI